VTNPTLSCSTHLHGLFLRPAYRIALYMPSSSSDTPNTSWPKPDHDRTSLICPVDVVRDVCSFTAVALEEQPGSCNSRLLVMFGMVEPFLKPLFVCCLLDFEWHTWHPFSRSAFDDFQPVSLSLFPTSTSLCSFLHFSFGLIFFLRWHRHDSTSDVFCIFVLPTRFLMPQLSYLHDICISLPRWDLSFWI
jgi:hypothetical protein